MKKVKFALNLIKEYLYITLTYPKGKRDKLTEAILFSYRKWLYEWSYERLCDLLVFILISIISGLIAYPFISILF